MTCAHTVDLLVDEKYDSALQTRSNTLFRCVWSADLWKVEKTETQRGGSRSSWWMWPLNSSLCLCLQSECWMRSNWKQTKWRTVLPLLRHHVCSLFIIKVSEWAAATECILQWIRDHVELGTCVKMLDVVDVFHCTLTSKHFQNKNRPCAELLHN